MPYVDLTDIEERRKAAAGGYIWSAPNGAILAMFADVQAGKYPPPKYIPDEWQGEAEKAGIVAPGMTEGSGPA